MLSLRPSAVCVSWQTLICYDPVWLLHSKGFSAPFAAAHCLRVSCWRPNRVVRRVIPVVREWYAAPCQHGQHQCHTLSEPLSKSGWYQTVIVCCNDSVHYCRCWCWRVRLRSLSLSLRDVAYSRLLSFLVRKDYQSIYMSVRLFCLVYCMLYYPHQVNVCLQQRDTSTCAKLAAVTDIEACNNKTHTHVQQLQSWQTEQLETTRHTDVCNSCSRDSHSSMQQRETHMCV